MGNQQSQTPSRDFQKQFQTLQNQLRQQQRQSVDLNQLQKQIYLNQLKIQELKMKEMQQNTYQHFPGPNNRMNSLLSSPELRHEMANNPSFGVQIIELILKEYGTQLTPDQSHKIDEYLEINAKKVSDQMNPFIQHTNNNINNIHNIKQSISIAPHVSTTTLSSKYQIEDERARLQFEKEEKERRKAFEDQQNRRKADYQNNLNSFKTTSDPYKVLGLNRNFTLEQLKKAYKTKALATHPDRGGNDALFSEVTKSYFSLLEELKNQDQDKQFIDLRNQSKDYMTQQTSQNKQNVKINNENFNVRVFNQIFEENRLDDPNDSGYESWLKNESSVKEPPKVFSSKFNLDVFNSTFDNWKAENDDGVTQQIMRRDEPDALVSYRSKTSFAELGGETPNNFSKADPNSRSLGYSDLKQAYSNQDLINIKTANARKSYRNIDEYERARANISYEMSREEMEAEELKRRQEMEREEYRQRRVRERDQMAFENYNRVHQMMLNQLK
jgi:curved DNA-binding protein CbpA